MGVFGVVTEPNTLVDAFMQKTHKNLQNDNVVKNPFIGCINKIDEGTQEAVWVIDMKPIYPDLSLFFGWLPFGITYYFFGWRWWQTLFLIICCSTVLWSAYFHYSMCVVGLRKYGYKGKIRFLSKRKLLVKKVV